LGRQQILAGILRCFSGEDGGEQYYSNEQTMNGKQRFHEGYDWGFTGENGAEAERLSPTWNRLQGIR
jgi:hypothetical protein